MIKQSSGLIFGTIVGIIGAMEGAIALTPHNNRPLNSLQRERLYGQTEILRRGDRSEAVEELQELLKAIGVFNDPITGFYGAETEAAVRRFQRDRGLIEDGVAGRQTRAAISAVARSQTRPNTSPRVSSPPVSPPRASSASSSSLPTFALGSQGNVIRQIQQRLQVLGYFLISPTGVYDETTREAVMKFQRDRGLNVDGIVGEKTIIALERSLSPQQIRALQQRLTEAGFYDSAIDGVWGEATRQAIESARETYGVSATDIVRGND